MTAPLASVVRSVVDSVRKLTERQTIIIDPATL